MYVLNLVKIKHVICNVSKFRAVYPALQCSVDRCATKSTFSQKLEREDDEEVDLNKPVQYSASPAYKWQAKHTRFGTSTEPRLWYEPYVVLGSIAIFMIYFTILREENEVDENLKKTLYDRIEGLEEHQLRQAYRYNLDNGLKTEDIVKRLREIEETKQKKQMEDTV